ncbi:MAG: glycosyltransferase family 1 protein [Bradyrhizobiaceae bacterium]|nr:MAG: glycosyltransferase family 1 protein [Bradyrhizobiaceae bacterium]
MNILLLTSEYAPMRGGIGTYAREIAEAATQLGAHVTLVAPDYGEDTSEADRLSPFAVHRFGGGLHSARDLPAKILLARRWVRSAPFDVIHAADWPFFIPAALARHLTPARMVMTVHGTEINETQTPSKRLAIRCSGAFGPRTTIAANSRFTRDLFRDKFDVDPKRIHAIRLGVSDFWSGRRMERAAVRMQREISPDRIVLVTVARITRRKGHHLTLQALARLPDALRRRITWLVIGPEGERELAGESGLLVQPRIDVIANVIEQIATDDDLRARLAAGARTHARDLSWARCAAETYGLPLAQSSAQIDTLSA